MAMPSGEPLWMLGFFTGRLHAVANPDTALVFKGVPLTWSVCGAPVVVDTDGAVGPFCPACVRLVGVTWLMAGTDRPAAQADAPNPLASGYIG